MKQALVFSPYFDTWGGGEVYTLSFAAALHQLGYRLTIAAASNQVLANANKFLDIKLSANVDIRAHQILTSSGSLWAKYQLTKTYDIAFFLSDGSLPFLFSKKNIVHFQVPFTSLSRSPLNLFKLPTIHHLVVNSNFTKQFIDRGLGVNSTVIYPPVRLITQSTSKQNTILSIGRFTQTLHHKRQDILVKAFKKMVDNGLKGWKLTIAGSTSEQGSSLLVEELKSEAKDYPITILTDISYQTIRNLYQKSKIFWLATGYDVNQAVHPENVEHFGIATVEAMSAGTVPVVIAKGGQPEIVTPNKTGYLFTNIDELVVQTNRLITSPQLLHTLSQAAISQSRKFSVQEFNHQVKSLIS